MLIPFHPPYFYRRLNSGLAVFDGFVFGHAKIAPHELSLVHLLALSAGMLGQDRVSMRASAAIIVNEPPYPHFLFLQPEE